MLLSSIFPVFSRRSTKESAASKRDQWTSHIKPSTSRSPVPQWLGSLLAPLRMILFFFSYTSTTSSSQGEWQVFTQCAMVSFALGVLPDLLAKNWRGAMQGQTFTPPPPPRSLFGRFCAHSAPLVVAHFSLTLTGVAGFNAHYCALSALLCFGAPGPFLPGTVRFLVYSFRAFRGRFRGVSSSELIFR